MKIEPDDPVLDLERASARPSRLRLLASVCACICMCVCLSKVDLMTEDQLTVSHSPL